MDMNRREYSRFKKNLRVIIHRPYNERLIETADVGLGGVSINNIQKFYDVEQIVYIELILEGIGSIFCNTRVVSVYPRGKDASTYKLNLQFLDMTDDDKKKLKTYIED